MSEVEKPRSTTEDGVPKSVSSDEEGESEQAFVSSVIPEPSSKDTESLQDGGDVTQGETPDQDVADATERLGQSSLNDHENTTPDPQDHQDSRLGSEVAPSSGTAEVVTEVTRRALSKSGAEHLRKLLCKSKSLQTTTPADVPPVVVKKSMLDILTQTLNDWRTEETLKYLFGTDYVVEQNENEESAEPDLDEDDLDDIEDSSMNDTTLNPSLPSPESKNDVSKPLPDYAKLREETETLEIRVREFFRGNMVLPEEVEHPINEHKGGTEATSRAPLPLVDSCSQQQVRRRIVLEKLKKVLPAILIPLQITYSDVSKELHDLVQTFKFSNTNIIHTVPEWSIIAIVLLSVLLPTMPLHKDSEQNPLYTQFVSKLLEELHFQKEDLDCLKGNLSSHTVSLTSV